ncbi:MAG: DUF4278 domain-containing protein [Cyanobacteria bacterium P01_F01_bin.116]
MQLTHLGASYTPSTQTVETVETDIELSFRSRPFKMRTVKGMMPKAATRSLIYRGICYRV